MGYNVCNDNGAVYMKPGICDQHVCDLNICEVCEVNRLIDKDLVFTGMIQRMPLGKFNQKYKIEGHNKHGPSLALSPLYKQSIKIFHQNIRSLLYKMNELLCHLNHDPPHILCLTEHHLHHEELSFLHAENYVLGSCYCRKSKHKGGVCIFVHNSMKFTSLDVDDYCIDQDCEVCAIHLNSADDKLCILAVYRSPLGNFNTFLTNFDLILHKFFNLNYNFIVCADFNVDYLIESHKKTQLNKILQSFNLSSIVDFPTRIKLNSFTSIDNFFINNSYLTNFDVSPLINGLSDHNGRMLTLQFTQQHIKDQCLYYKRLINQTTIDDFLFKLSHETWASVF